MFLSHGLGRPKVVLCEEALLWKTLKERQQRSVEKHYVDFASNMTGVLIPSSPQKLFVYCATLTVIKERLSRLHSPKKEVHEGNVSKASGKAANSAKPKAKAEF